MVFPSIIVQPSDPMFLSRGRNIRCEAVPGTVNARTIVVFVKIMELLPQIMGIPERHEIEKLPTDGADQTFDKGMR